MLGRVNSSGEAILAIQVRGPRGRPVEFQAVIDTGFNDWLALSPGDVSALELPFREEGRYVLADQIEVVTRLFSAEVNWFGRWRRILVGEMEGAPLIGMALLNGCFLGVEVAEGGLVEVRPLGS